LIPGADCSREYGNGTSVAEAWPWSVSACDQRRPRGWPQCVPCGRRRWCSQPRCSGS